MYIIIKKNKAEHLKEKLHKAKEIVSEIMECFDEASEERDDRYEDEGRERRRIDAWYGAKGRRDDYYEDDYERDEARGRGRGRGGRY